MGRGVRPRGLPRIGKHCGVGVVGLGLDVAIPSGSIWGHSGLGGRLLRVCARNLSADRRDGVGLRSPSDPEYAGG